MKFITNFRLLMMMLSKITICVFLAFVFFSIMLSKLQNTIKIDEDKIIAESLTSQDENTKHINKPWSDEKQGRGSENGPLPGAEFKHMMTFVQLSDLHISIFTDPARSTDLTTFCSDVIPILKPSVVVASGDLTDGKTPDHFGSRQYLDEWKIYQKSIMDSGVLEKTVWLDIRGNHDNLNVPGVNSKLNYFRQYSVQGKKHIRSYNYTFNHDGDTYTFIGIDACMEPGPKRPFNFLGVINREEYNKLEKLSKESLSSNMTIWFGHYTTSTMIAPEPGVRELMRRTGPYLCGHLHTVGGLVPAMYTLQPTGSLELELADWKDTRKFRVGVVDHGLFSFIDVVYKNWPIILVTNPKHALYTMPSVEPLNRIKNSTHIRVLVYNPEPVLLVKLRIDHGMWNEMSLVKEPLYVLQWDPSLYATGLHTIEVSVLTKNESETVIEQPFSLDGTRPSFPMLARFVLMGHINGAQVVFACLVVLLGLPLISLRIMHHLKKDKMIRRKSRNNWFRKQIFKFYLIATVNRLFWPLILTLIYIAVGPWFIGEIIDGYVGALFVWGIVIKGTFIPTGLTFVVGIIHLMTFYLPLLCTIGSCVYRHYRLLQEGGAPACSFAIYAYRHVALIFLVIWQALCAVAYLLSYGYLATLLGLLTTYSVVLVLVLWRFAVTVPESLFPKRDTSKRDGKKDSLGVDGSQIWAMDSNVIHRESRETLLNKSKPSSNTLDSFQESNASTHF